MGEGMKSDNQIMPFIDSANIACGEHAGDDNTIRDTIRDAIKHSVKIGAHPGYADRKNFGRKEIELREDELYALIIRQVNKVKKIAEEEGGNLIHVKPHGALYNMAAKDELISKTIVAAIKEIDANIILVGLSGSILISQGKQNGLKTLSEVFADRTYQDDGSLTPRNQPNALLEDTGRVVQQVIQIIKEQTVTTISGKIIPVVAETICIHGDGKNAEKFAKAIYEKVTGMRAGR